MDWENNKSGLRILRFEGVTNYSVAEIPFKGNPAILEIEEMGANKTTLGSGMGQMIFERSRIKLLTNAGDRIIDYVTCDLLKPRLSIRLQRL